MVLMGWGERSLSGPTEVWNPHSLFSGALLFLELPSKIGLGDEGDEMRNRVAKSAKVAEQMGARLYDFHIMGWDDDRFHAKPRVAISKRP